MIANDQDVIHQYEIFQKEFKKAKLLLLLFPTLSAISAFLIGSFFDRINTETQLTAAFITFGIIGFFCLFCFLLTYYIDQPVIKGQYNAVMKSMANKQTS